MIRKTINNEGEWVKVQEELFAQGCEWAATGKTVTPFCGNPYPVFIKIKNGIMTWGTFDSLDIAESVSNEAVYLHALEHVYDEICRISRAVKERGVDHVQARNMQDESLSHIRSICATAIQSCYTGNGEVDRTQEYEEDKLSNRMV